MFLEQNLPSKNCIYYRGVVEGLRADIPIVPLVLCFSLQVRVQDEDQTRQQTITFETIPLMGREDIIYLVERVQADNAGKVGRIAICYEDFSGEKPENKIVAVIDGEQQAEIDELILNALE